LDNLSRGFRAAVDPSVPFYEGDIADRALIENIAREHSLESCIHFAAYAYVGESVFQPSLYFTNNVERSIKLLDALLGANVPRVVFSSTCATYGEPRRDELDESHPQQPTNPYGWSKFFVERVMEAYDRAHDLKFVALRYFNAAGATDTRGEDHQPETHLIPLALAAARGERANVSIFGGDYPTPDGTAIRDYIHVADLAEAHLLALQYLRNGGASQSINLGNGQGYSVREVIETARRIVGRPIEVVIEPRRAGDPARLVARAAKARTVLGWTPARPELSEMIRSAWDWRQNNPQGYGA
ncbi:MAG TPA: UDP-glucose 4-epimerase GalE, partial [Pyrinomonadaceae bacterium]|nr:UDP-glucose 4-epimerase GalE [Pyrinomonadaceae bacterium]